MAQPTSVTNGQPQDTVSPRTKRNLTVLESIFSGSFIGAIEVLVNYPLWSIKVQIQNGDPFTLNPKMLYRGLVPNAFSMIPTTALQVGLDQWFQNYLFKDTAALSQKQLTATAFFAGVGSSMICCPTEMIMLKQRYDRLSFLVATQRLIQQRGVSSLYSGLVATALREGLFTSFFLVATPALKAKIKPYYSNDYGASLLAGFTSGVGATLMSQGVDTIKTRQQSASTTMGFVQTAKQIYASQGMPGFFKGTIPRGVRVMSAITLMGFVNEKIENALNDHKENGVNTFNKR